ncbi:hypothetical protein IVB14_04720 [Bradyrhizobium sp. 180]|uniref:hypothetical protein n=1 Tax=Bradyrhizobium sp. 180 TaxID=2782650 RepID=UPI001FF889E7|nr:hypothetical protein [Bradyrhizobium sp. 180]MCK1489741.1 hypothetical protein [Bradyrhizobium sp. 180]
MTLHEKTKSDNHANENFQTLSPLQELKFLSAMMADSELPMTARVVGFRLVRWTNGKKDHRYHGHAWAGREKLAEWIGRDSKTTITTATKALEARGWIVTKRRRNETNLVRPNWSRADQEFQEDQKTEFPEDQFSVHPEDQKTGPYSADPNSADPYSADQVHSGAAYADRSARPDSEVDCAYGVDRQTNEHSAGRYQQTQEQAEQDWVELNRILTGTSEDADHQPAESSAQGAKVRWYRLLKSGVPSSQILQSARGYLERKPDGQWQSGVGGFLTSFDPEQLPDGTYPEDERHAANDNRRYDRASGDDDLNEGVEVDV